MRHLLQVGLACAALTVAACATARADLLHVGKASPSTSPMLPVNIGAQEGIFASHGLDVQVSDFTGGGKLHQAMIAGSIDIGVGSGPELALIAKGAPELAVANAVPTAAGIGIVVGANSPIHSLADLHGKTLGVSSTGSLTYWLALELARKQGWGPGGLHIVAVGGATPGVAAALRTHAIDADISATSLGFDMERLGQGRLLAPVSDYEGNLCGGTIYATDALIARDPEAIRRFLLAWFDTIAWMRAHKAETVAIESKLTGFDPTVMAREYDLTIGAFSPTGHFDQELLDNLQRSFVDLKLLDGKVDMSKLYTERFLPGQ